MPVISSFSPSLGSTLTSVREHEKMTIITNGVTIFLALVAFFMCCYYYTIKGTAIKGTAIKQ